MKKNLMGRISESKNAEIEKSASENSRVFKIHIINGE